MNAVDKGVHQLLGTLLLPELADVVLSHLCVPLPFASGGVQLWRELPKCRHVRSVDGRDVFWQFDGFWRDASLVVRVDQLWDYMRTPGLELTSGPIQTAFALLLHKNRTRALSQAPVHIQETIGGYLMVHLADGWNPMTDDVHQEGELRFVTEVGSSRVDLQACKLEYSIVSPK